MTINSVSTLSKEGEAFLNDKALKKKLSKIAKSVGVTPEEYLIRFEEILSTNPQKIFDIFEKKAY